MNSNLEIRRMKRMLESLRKEVKQLRESVSEFPYVEETPEIFNLLTLPYDELADDITKEEILDMIDAAEQSVEVLTKEEVKRQGRNTNAIPTTAEFWDLLQLDVNALPREFTKWNLLNMIDDAEQSMSLNPDFNR